MFEIGPCSPSYICIRTHDHLLRQYVLQWSWWIKGSYSAISTKVCMYSITVLLLTILSSHMLRIQVYSSKPTGAKSRQGLWVYESRYIRGGYPIYSLDTSMWAYLSIPATTCPLTAHLLHKDITCPCDVSEWCKAPLLKVLGQFFFTSIAPLR